MCSVRKLRIVIPHLIVQSLIWPSPLTVPYVHICLTVLFLIQIQDLILIPTSNINPVSISQSGGFNQLLEFHEFVTLFLEELYGSHYDL